MWLSMLCICSFSCHATWLWFSKEIVASFVQQGYVIRAVAFLAAQHFTAAGIAARRDAAWHRCDDNGGEFQAVFIIIQHFFVHVFAKQNT